MLATETFLKTKIKDDSAFLNGFPRNAAWLYNRCRVRADTKLTAHEKTHQRVHAYLVVEIGEAIVCRPLGAAQNKLELTWVGGLRLRREARTNEHLVGTLTVVTGLRAIRRRMVDRRWDLQLFSPRAQEKGDPVSQSNKKALPESQSKTCCQQVTLHIVDQKSVPVRTESQRKSQQ